MGKKSKAHNKKVQDRNKRLKDQHKHTQRVRTKLIEQLIKEHEEKKKAQEAEQDNVEQKIQDTEQD